MDLLLNNIFGSIAIIALMILIFKRYKEILSPSLVIPIFIGAYIVLGNINLVFFKNVIGWFTDIDPTEGNLYAIIGLIILQLVLLLPSKKKSMSNEAYINKSRFDRFLISLIIISTFLNIINYSSIGGVVFLKSGLSGYERFNLREKLPFPKAILISSFLLCPIIIRVIIYNEKRKLFLFFLSLQAFLAFGMGDRHLVFLPCLTALFILYYIGKISKKLIIILILCMPFFLMLTSLLRGDGDSVALKSTSSYFGGEYRDYLRLTNEANIKFENGQTIASVFFNALPQQLYQILGENKDDYAIYSAYVLMELWGNETGQRAGIWGEFYLNFGFIGVLICFALYGLLLRILQSNLKLNFHFTRRKVLSAYFFSLFFFSVFGSWATIGDDIGFNGILYATFAYYAFRKNRYKIKIGKPSQILNEVNLA